MDSLLLLAGMALLLILAAMAIEHGADSRDGFGGERTARPRA
jgi:hypothetical protein